MVIDAVKIQGTTDFPWYPVRGGVHVDQGAVISIGRRVRGGSRCFIELPVCYQVGIGEYGNTDLGVGREATVGDGLGKAVAGSI